MERAAQCSDAIGAAVRTFFLDLTLEQLPATAEVADPQREPDLALT